MSTNTESQFWQKKIAQPALFGWLQIRIAFPSGKRQRRGGQQNVEFSDTYFVRDRSV